METLYDIYCDESCHLENDGINTMAVGGVWCPDAVKAQLFDDLRAIKVKHGFASYWELKWNAVSEARFSYYADVVRYFFSRQDLNFRVLVVPDKSLLKQNRVNQTHEQLYYKLYFDMLKHILNPGSEYHVYLDIKDTRGQRKIEQLQRFLCNIKNYDFNKNIVSRIQLVRSHEVELVQLADFLIGAVGYANRGLKTSSAKLKIVEMIRKQSGYSLLRSTLTRENKMNVYILNPKNC